MARISDPKAMRALAHPLRIQLLEMVVARGQATATELAQALGETPANCSFHLRKLAEYGYLERADDAAGREKPWRATDPTQDFTPDPGDPEALRANTAVVSAVREWEMARLQAAEGRRNPPEWRGATFQSGATMFVTPDEARQLAHAITDLLAPYHARLTDRSLRPHGVGAIRMFTASTYLPEYQELLDAQGAQPAPSRAGSRRTPDGSGATSGARSSEPSRAAGSAGPSRSRRSERATSRRSAGSGRSAATRQSKAGPR